MRYIVCFTLFVFLLSCNRPKSLVSSSFVDSLISNYAPSRSAITNEKDILFWKQRVDSLPESFVNLEKYAIGLASRFHIYGDIKDLKKADSIIKKISFQFKEPGMFLALAGFKMQQHQFHEAKSYIDIVEQMKAERYATQMMLFDVNFELGDNFQASTILKKNYSPSDYAYNFRLSKQDHYKGELDSSVAHMLKAADIGKANPYLQSAALSNAADLNVHEGQLKKAAQLYQQCIRFNSCDFHSMMGLGWIALVHDGNDSLARKIFSFVRTKLQSPDPLLKLAIATESTDSSASKKFAMEFIRQASQPVYGNMYNKYLIQVYTSILNEPAKALSIAQNEINNRATSQTYAWLAWAQFYNGHPKEAYKTYQNYVSGKALEGLELYWMGKMMKGLNKNYNAQQFLKAAEKNKYDLSPVMRKDLEENL